MAKLVKGSELREACTRCEIHPAALEPIIDMLPHRHTCGKCGHQWEHCATDEPEARSHKCGKCGEAQYIVDGWLAPAGLCEALGI